MTNHADIANFDGFCAPGWERVAERFVENFRTRGDVGASLSVQHHGETVVDLGAGWADASRSLPWTRDTLSVIYSATKPAVALCAHLLADRGELDLHAPVSRYWPGFAKNGKEGVTVSMLLDHTAGVPGFREPLKDGAYLDWDHMVARIEDEVPFWEPGTRQGYHIATFGWTVGEVVRRVSGQDLGSFFRTQIAEPLGLDFWIGLPAEQESRVAPMLPPIIDETTVLPPIVAHVMANPEALIAKAFSHHGGMSLIPASDAERAGVDTPAYHAAQLGAVGGIANARSLAGLYAPFTRSRSGLLSTRQVTEMTRVSAASHRDAITCIPTRYLSGFFGRLDNRHLPDGDALSLLIGERAFGHPGMGGSLGFADPELGIAFGYTVNQMGMASITDPRAQSLVDIVYDVAGNGRVGRAQAA